MDKHLLRFDFKSKILFFDFETQNLNLYKDFDLPWQYGYVLFQGTKVLKRGTNYIWWGDDYVVSPGAAFVTRYSRKKHKECGVDPAVAFKDLDDVVGEADIIGGHHVLGFDIFMWRNFILQMGKKVPEFTDWRWLDTLALAKAIHFQQVPPKDRLEQFLFQHKMLKTWPGKGFKFTLEELLKQCKIQYDPDQLHDALADIELNVEYWHHLKKNIDI